MGEASISARGLLVVAKLRRRGIQIYRCRATLQGTCRARLATWRRFHHRRCKDGRHRASVASPSDVTLRVAAASLCVGRPPDFDCCGLGNTRAPSTAPRSSGSRRVCAAARAQSSTVVEVGGHSGCFRGMRELFVSAPPATASRAVTYGSDNSGVSDRGNVCPP